MIGIIMFQQASSEFNMTGFSRREALSFAASSLLWTLPRRSALALPAPAARPRIGEAQFTADLHARLGKLAAENNFSAAVLIAHGEKIVFEHAYGWADHAFKVPNQVDTKFNIASVGKMFTAVSILQLVQQGKLALSDPLIKLLPDYPDKDIAAKINVEQLLTHTSGLGDMFNEKYFNASPANFDTLGAFLPLFAGNPLLFEPGTKWAYSNAGFLVLGLIIEKLSGESYYDYVRKYICEPAGMTGTDSYRTHDDVPNLALGYRPPHKPGLGIPGGVPPQPRTTNVDVLARGTSAGGGYSTAGDLLRFCRALQGNKLLNKDYTGLGMAGKVATGQGTGKYAFGMFEDFINGVRVVGHSGGGPGSSCNVDMYTDLGYTVVVLDNLEGNHYLANERIRMWLTGQEIPTPVRLPATAFQSFVGTYAIARPGPGGPGGGIRIRPGDAPPPGLRPPPGAGGPPPGGPPPTMGGSPPGGGGAVLEIAAGGEDLWLTSTTRIRMLALSESEFFSDNVPTVRISFHKDENGQVAGLTLTVPGYPLITANKTS
jgi:CubicO group peptidase (beta-lactamase class C family)